MESNCLSDQELLAFHLGKMPAGEVDRVANHLEACAGCTAAMERLDYAADPVLTALRKPASETKPATASAASAATWPPGPGTGS
jgi:anti-sigma factor RsiW